MTLDQFSEITNIISNLTSVLILAISATAAVFIYRWQRRLGKIETIRKQNDDLLSYNLLVLENAYLQEIETDNHRWGTLTKDEVKKMYSYFILFNVSYNLHSAFLNDSVDPEVYTKQLDNAANTTYKERDFILQHVFPRGYTNKFCEEVADRWDLISKKGTI